MKDIKIVIGANYGDEGKGLTSRHFATKNDNSIVILDNGTAQRGHTVDYSDGTRHVFHHFGSAALDGVPTYYGPDFLLHPMTYVQEREALNKRRIPNGAYSGLCNVITPFDMMVDHMTEDYIQYLKGEREYGSCGFGSWCATERIKKFGNTTITDLTGTKNNFTNLMKMIKIQCLSILEDRKVDITKISSNWNKYLEEDGLVEKNIIINFWNDLIIFLLHNTQMEFNELWDKKEHFVFEMGQGLGLDKDVDNEWHTSSHTGLTNPYNLLKNQNDFRAEVCYVSRTYLTRHGEGPLEDDTKKDNINENIYDETNIYNNFQGNLRFGYLEEKAQKERIAKDWSIVENDNRFSQAMVLTHWNEFSDVNKTSKYYSDNKFEIKER